MSSLSMSSATKPVDDFVKRFDVPALIKQLSAIWRGHQKNGIEVRHRIGKLLNKKLGPTSKRQKYARSVVKSVARELGVNETNVCRFRRFAEQYPVYADFCDKHPDVTSWTEVRNLITESRKSVSGGRKSCALVRSLRSAVATLRSPEPLASARAEEINRLLRELFDAARCRDEIRLQEHNEASRVA
jgi:hypothetical protein